MKSSRKGRRATKKLAKYKLGFGWSSSAATLGYYHLSRILGNIALVPPAVIRTVDADFHEKLAELGVKSAGKNYPNEAIHKNWKKVLRILQRRSDKRMLIDDGEQSFGALGENPRGERFYSQMFKRPGVKVKWRDRPQEFKKLPFYRDLVRDEHISSFIGKTFNSTNAQRLQIMKDASDLIVMDYIMGQGDRFGNVAKQKRYIYFKQNDSGDWEADSKKYKSKSAERIAKMKEKGGIVISFLMLKDNNAALYAKSNRTKKLKFVEEIRHMSKETYRRTQWLNSIAADPKTSDFFKNQLLFTDQDYGLFRQRLLDLSSKLLRYCQSGRIKLDLNLAAHFKGDNRVNRADCQLR